MRPIRSGLCLIALCFSASAVDLSAEWRLDEGATMRSIRAAHEYDTAVEASMPTALQRMRANSYRFEGNVLLAANGSTSERIPIRWIEQSDEHALLRGRARGRNFEIYLEYLDDGNLRMHSTLDPELSLYVWKPGRPGDNLQLLQASVNGDFVTDIVSNPSQ